MDGKLDANLIFKPSVQSLVQGHDFPLWEDNFSLPQGIQVHIHPLARDCNRNQLRATKDFGSLVETHTQVPVLAFFDPRSVILVVQNGDQFRSAKAFLEQDQKQWENVQNQHACLLTCQAML